MIRKVNPQLGIRLKELRTKKKWSLRRVADMIGVNYSYLYSIEEGEHVPSDEVLSKILKVYSLSQSEKFDIFNLAHLSQEYTEVLENINKDDFIKSATSFYRHVKKQKNEK